MSRNRQPAREMTARERAADSEMRKGAEQARLRRQQDYENSLRYRKPLTIFAGLAVGAITYYTFVILPAIEVAWPANVMLGLILLFSIYVCNSGRSVTVRKVYRLSVAVWPILIGLFMLKVYWPQIAERMQWATHLIDKIPGI